ncbi:hypothetical protein [Pasteuria penetrans]|uniref:hypothetical protein n=1 Tax=Pasteuria penetrans TaxID=86005 RepID=UPI000FBE2B53|nr:hypothetical protein [Pasteuria penetrans]
MGDQFRERRGQNHRLVGIRELNGSEPLFEDVSKGTVHVQIEVSCDTLGKAMEDELFMIRAACGV